MEDLLNRRQLVRSWGLSAAAFIASPGGRLLEAKEKEDEEEEVSPNEDLMREHGVLKRVLLIYREIIRRIDAKQEYPPNVVLAAAKLIRTFIEDYHEKLEEDYLFPRFRKANQHIQLVNTLYTQHQKGRILTGITIQLATNSVAKDDAAKEKLKNSLYEFVRMYEPHEAREDTVLFPAFRKIVSKHEFDALGEEFERKENELFHGDGFEKNVEAVAKLEKQLGIYDLAQFTPHV
jgi:hemerythrin-like domain-containing protein